MKRELIGLGISIVIAVVLLAPIPSLYSPSSLLGLSNPYTGIWPSIYSGSYPAHDTITIPGLEHQVTVIIDSYGVPHVFAESEKDMAYVVGYLHAHDRLFQMDLQRRLVEGRLSEVIGSATYEADLLYRVLGLYRGANKSLELLQKIAAGQFISYYSQLNVSLVKNDAAAILQLLDAYCAGVNAGIGSMEKSGTLPVEFKLLGYQPEPWTRLNVLEIDRLISWGLTGSFDDLSLFLIYQGLIGKYGVQNATKYLLEYFPIDRPIDHYIIPDGVNPIHVVDPADPPEGSPAPSQSMNVNGVNEIIDWAKQTDPFLAPIRQALIGSNNWVVGGNLTNTGKPIVCNDPHLSLSAPGVWYELHYVAKVSGSKVINVRGVTLPGVGFVVIGSNQYVGWGFTNVMADHMDFYYYNWNSVGQYLYKGSWRNVEQISQEILVKTDGGVEKHSITLNFTVHGPIVERGGVRFAAEWMGERYGSTEAIALYKYAHASDAYDFLKSTYYWQMPPQNHVFADIYGNFGYRAAGWYPNRTYPDGTMAISASNPMTALTNRLPLNGSASNVIEWNINHWIDSNQAPTLWNPKQGYVVTANNRHASNNTYPYCYDIAWGYADYYRAYRIDRDINQTITANGSVSVEDMKKIQNDVFLVPASTLVPKILQAYSGGASGDTQAALNTLNGWNYTMLTDLAAPTIFVEWLPIFKNMTFADEFISINQTVTGFRISKGDLNDIVNSVPTNSLEALTLLDPSNHWFDNVFTSGTIENATTIIRASLERAIQALKTKYGDDMTQWKFGNVHKLQFNHQLLSWFDYPHWSAWGYSDCVNNIASTGNSGPSWREILNFDNLDQSFCIIPGGQSGSPISPHYYDQLRMWLDGQYKSMTFPATSVAVTDVESVLVFVSG
nr:penicillin acylase family protein [Candidatus Njordarchaeum guaymaensis]